MFNNWLTGGILVFWNMLHLWTSLSSMYILLVEYTNGVVLVELADAISTCCRALILIADGFLYQWRQTNPYESAASWNNPTIVPLWHSRHNFVDSFEECRFPKYPTKYSNSQNLFKYSMYKLIYVDISLEHWIFFLISLK